MVVCLVLRNKYQDEIKCMDSNIMAILGLII